MGCRWLPVGGPSPHVAAVLFWGQKPHPPTSTVKPHRRPASAGKWGREIKFLLQIISNRSRWLPCRGSFELLNLLCCRDNPKPDSPKASGLVGASAPSWLLAIVKGNNNNNGNKHNQTAALPAAAPAERSQHQGPGQVSSTGVSLSPHKNPEPHVGGLIIIPIFAIGNLRLREVKLLI